MSESSPSFRSTLREDLRAYLSLAIITVLVFWPWLFAGKAFYWGDTGLYFLPLTRFLGQNLQHNIVPLWNPYILCGTPYVGNPQAWPFYPSSILLAFVSAPVYLMLVNVLHLWLAGAGFYCFLRRGRTRLDFYAAIIGALAFMLGGFLVSKTQFPNMVQALAYVPIVLLCTERLIERATVPRALLLGVAFGLQIMAAHAQISVLTFYLAAFYAVACCIWQAQWKSQKLKCLLPLVGLALLVALSLSCIYWLPVLELLQVAERQRLGVVEAHRFYLLPQELTNLFWPMRSGSPLAGDWSAPGNFWEKACYMGLIPCLLGIAGLRLAFIKNHKYQRPAGFWCVVLIISLLLALGWQGGLFLLAYYVAPGIKLFHDPARMLLGASIAVPVLAALGAHGVLRRLSPTQMRMAATILILFAVVDLGWFAHSIYPLQSVQNIEAMPEQKLVQSIRNDADIKQGRARIFFADPFKNRQHFLQYKTYHANDSQFLSHWSQTLMPNLGMLFDLPQAGGYEPVAARNAKRRAAKAEKANSEYSELLATMSIKYLIIYGPQPLRSTPGLELVGQSSQQHRGYRAYVYRNLKFVPRAYWQGAVAGSIVTKTSLSPNVLQFHFSASEHERHLVVADSAYAGWHAYLNGQEINITPTSDGFRSVHIPQAKTDKHHRLFFIYQPATFQTSLFITLCCLMLLSAYCGQRLLLSLVGMRGPNYEG